MTPNEVANYRTQTERFDRKPLNWKTQVCTCCKRSRSIAQYKGNSKVCNTCRGMK